MAKAKIKKYHAPGEHIWNDPKEQKHQDARRFLNHLVNELNILLRTKGGKVFSKIDKEFYGNPYLNEIHYIKQKIGLFRQKEVARVKINLEGCYMDLGIHITPNSVEHFFCGYGAEFWDENTESRDAKIEYTARRLLLENEYSFDSAFLISGLAMSGQQEIQLRGQKPYLRSVKGLYQIFRLDDLKDGGDDLRDEKDRLN